MTTPVFHAPLRRSIGCTHDLHKSCLASEWHFAKAGLWSGEVIRKVLCCQCECHYTKEGMELALGHKVEA